MQTLKQKQLLQRWKDKGWTYHPASSHDNATEFRERMTAYGKPPTQLGQIIRGRK